MIKLLKLRVSIRVVRCSTLDVTGTQATSATDHSRRYSILRMPKMTETSRSTPQLSTTNTMKPQTPRISFPIAVYSHRGGSLESRPTGGFYVENTLPAFLNSARIGVDLLELDVQLTADGRWGHPTAACWGVGNKFRPNTHQHVTPRLILSTPNVAQGGSVP